MTLIVQEPSTVAKEIFTAMYVVIVVKDTLVPTIATVLQENFVVMALRNVPEIVSRVPMIATALQENFVAI